MFKRIVLARFKFEGPLIGADYDEFGSAVISEDFLDKFLNEEILSEFSVYNDSEKITYLTLNYLLDIDPIMNDLSNDSNDIRYLISKALENKSKLTQLLLFT